MAADWIEAVGFLAAALTLATFAQTAMIPMRLTAIAANLCFISYGALGSYMPVLALHVALLPLNAIRLWPLLRTVVGAGASRQGVTHLGAAPHGVARPGS